MDQPLYSKRPSHQQSIAAVAAPCRIENLLPASVDPLRMLRNAVCVTRNTPQSSSTASAGSTAPSCCLSNPTARSPCGSGGAGFDQPLRLQKVTDSVNFCKQSRAVINRRSQENGPYMVQMDCRCRWRNGTQTGHGHRYVLQRLAGERIPIETKCPVCAVVVTTTSQFS